MPLQQEMCLSEGRCVTSRVTLHDGQWFGRCDGHYSQLPHTRAHISVMVAPNKTHVAVPSGAMWNLSG